MNVEAELLKAQVIKESEELKEDKSLDFQEGFEAGVELISRYHTEIMKIYKLIPEESR